MKPGSVAGRIVPVAVLALVAVAAPAVAPASAKVPTARLGGAFAMTGRITVSANVQGERAGQKLARSWTFKPLCHSGPCATVVLVRHRPHGKPLTIVLHRRRPGYYIGASFFFAPLRCSGRLYPHGEVVPYGVTVQVASTMSYFGNLLVSRIIATYTNQARINLTPCVAFSGNDIAHYQGRLRLPGH